MSFRLDARAPHSNHHSLLNWFSFASKRFEKSLNYEFFPHFHFYCRFKLFIIYGNSNFFPPVYEAFTIGAKISIASEVCLTGCVLFYRAMIYSSMFRVCFMTAKQIALKWKRFTRIKLVSMPTLKHTLLN